MTDTAPVLFANDQTLTPIRAVHLDLKGLPPTPERLLALLDLFAHLRYNAVLVEWEDMFHWTIDPRFRCETSYTPNQISAFLARAKSLNIDVIPLVQCLGHMETFLRPPEYAHLREIPHLCDVINPLHPESRALVERLVDDVLALMPDVKYFHLGGDEAWTFGTHPDTRAYIARHGKGALYLHHVQPLLDKLNAKNIRPILWHDMMIEWDDASLQKLSSSADLCVWGYGETPDETEHHYATRHIERFHTNGVKMWGATAYKGADGHNVDVPDIAKRQHNALGWADIAVRFPLRGLIATAWSRYNTNVQQCEPIDGALDALAMVAVLLHDGAPPESGLDTCLTFLTSTGEGNRLAFCKSTLERISTLRKQVWTAVQDVRERLALVQHDPRRTGSAQQSRRCAELEKTLSELDSAAATLHQALLGCVDPLWITRYLDERISPLRAEFETLRPQTLQLDPQPPTTPPATTPSA
jgi:hexosaminidase